MPASLNKQVTNEENYEITPHRSDKVVIPSTFENYNIDDISSGDETDDDDNPKKKVPAWANKHTLIKKLKAQYSFNHNIQDIFQV